MAQVNECQQEANAFIFVFNYVWPYSFLEIAKTLYDQKCQGFLSPVYIHVSLLAINSTLTKN